MDRSGSVVARQQLLLWAGIVAVTLGLLAMHQLSLNHSIVDPTAGHVAVAAPAHLDQHKSDDNQVGGQAHPMATIDQVPRSGDSGCPGCADHHTVALTCLAALILVALGWALSGPHEWRGFRLRPLFLRTLPETPRWTPLPLSLAELSISRT